jgi:glycine cleavage system H protein
MSNIPKDLKYTRSHEWVKLNANVATIGITDYAQHMLGDLVYVDLPSVNEAIHKGNDAAAVESVKTASDIYSPLSGKVIEVNESLPDKPNLISEDPYNKGWIFKIELTDQNEITDLLDAQGYESLIANEPY